MSIPTSILCPRDFSKNSARALEYALHLAQQTGADLHLFHADVLHADPVSEMQAAERETPVEVLRERLRTRADGTDIETPGDLHIATGRDLAAAPAIIRYAEEHDIDLIVMGTHGRRGIRRLLLGSVTEEVIRMAPCDILVLRRDAELPTDKPIVVPFDFSRFSRNAFLRAQALAEVTGQDLHLLHVTFMVPYPPFYSSEELKKYDTPSRLITTAKEEMEALFQEDGHLPLERVHFVTRLGQPHEEITRYTDSVDAVLIVMGTHGLSGFQRIMLGSTTERTLRLASQPILVTRLHESEETEPS